MHPHRTTSLLILTALCLSLGLAACGVGATPTPDVRAGLLADIAAYEARFGAWVVPSSTLDTSRYAASQSFLMGRPELARYVTWAYPRRSSVGLLMQNLRDERNLRDYLAQR